MTLSPAIIAMLGDKNLVTLLTGSIEIIRRGIWNLFRVEKEHLVNCVEFKAIPDLKGLEDKLQEELVTETLLNVRNKEHAKNREIVRKEFIDLIKVKLAEREAAESAFTEEYEASQLKKLEETRRSIKNIISFVEKINQRHFK